MTSKLIPHSPEAVTVIREVTPNITTTSAPFNRFGRIKVGGRGTIVRLSNGSLAVISPTALITNVRQRVEAMGGNVRYLIAPDIEHHIFLSDWAKAYPGATVLGVEGLPEKREQNADTKGTVFSHVWTAKNKASLKVDPVFDQDFDVEFVDGHANRELVLNYKPDKTLITADLIFNLPPTEQYSKSPESPNTFLGRLFSFMQNTKGNAMGQRRFLWYLAAKNRPSFNQSVRRINGWTFDRIIMCHGDVIETGGKAVFDKVFSWHLQDKSQ